MFAILYSEVWPCTNRGFMNQNPEHPRMPGLWKAEIKFMNTNWRWRTFGWINISNFAYKYNYLQFSKICDFIKNNEWIKSQEMAWFSPESPFISPFYVQSSSIIPSKPVWVAIILKVHSLTRMKQVMKGEYLDSWIWTFRWFENVNSDTFNGSG